MKIQKQNGHKPMVYGITDGNCSVPTIRTYWYPDTAAIRSAGDPITDNGGARGLAYKKATFVDKIAGAGGPQSTGEAKY